MTKLNYHFSVLLFFTVIGPLSEKLIAQHTHTADHLYCETDSLRATQSVVKPKDSSPLLRPVRKVKSLRTPEGHQRTEVSIPGQSAIPSTSVVPHFRTEPHSEFGGGSVVVSDILTSEELHVLVTDLYGRTILYRRFDPGHEVIHYKVGLNARNIENGVYTLQVVKGGNIHIQKFVISNSH